MVDSQGSDGCFALIYVHNKQVPGLDKLVFWARELFRGLHYPQLHGNEWKTPMGGVG